MSDHVTAQVMLYFLLLVAAVVAAVMAAAYALLTDLWSLRSGLSAVFIGSERESRAAGRLSPGAAWAAHAAATALYGFAGAGAWLFFMLDAYRSAYQEPPVREIGLFGALAFGQAVLVGVLMSYDRIGARQAGAAALKLLRALAYFFVLAWAGMALLWAAKEAGFFSFHEVATVGSVFLQWAYVVLMAFAAYPLTGRWAARHPAPVAAAGGAAPFAEGPGAYARPGTRAQPRVQRRSFAVPNPGRAELEVVVSSETPWLAVEPSSARIPPGEEQLFVVTLDRSRMGDAGETGRIRVRLTADGREETIEVEA